MSKKEKTSERSSEPFFVTSMQDMGGNRGETPENEILWEEETHAKKGPPPSYSK